jgi:class 3 adenylate cyclase
MVDRGEHRIGDAERQQAIDMLRTHVGAGRLTLDEFSELAGDVFASQTVGDLDAVVRSLPPGVGPGPQAPSADGAAPRPVIGPDQTSAAPGGPATRRVRSRRRFVAIMSGSHMRGRWRAPARIWALAFWGGVHIDLREAEIEAGVVDITAWAVMGGVTVTVPPGVPVDVDGLVVMGGSHNLTSTDEPLPGAPLVRVHARGMWGGVHATTKRTRAQRAAARGRGEPEDERVVPPLRPSDPLELARPVLDEVARTLSRLDGRTGVPVHRHRRHDPDRDSRRDRYRDRGRDRDMRGEAAPPPAPPGVPVVPDGAGDGSSAAAAPSHPTGTLTMLVTDITKSTALAERLGDHRWMGVLGEHNALVREQVARHGGTEIKAQGDGFLVVFSSARRAILAAVEVQRALARYRDTHPDTPVDVRIGLHTGEIVDVDGDVFGQNVVVAVRIADEAAPGEIVVSALTRDLTVSGGDLTFGPAEEVQLKGLSQPWRVHRVDWARERA